MKIDPSDSKYKTSYVVVLQVLFFEGGLSDFCAKSKHVLYLDFQISFW